uniref:Uncharacterized protein n=1 Tax=viral metagenome TaxID=1070528 RepID=A0A6M3L2Y3_9ZZZZ
MADPDLSRAQSLIRSLVDALRSWERIDRIRASLPRQHAAKIPPSRASVVRSLLAHFQGKGWIRPSSSGGGGDLGWIPAALVVLGFVVVGAAGVVGVLHFASQIQTETGKVRLAEIAAEQARRAWSIEQAQASRVGILEARRLAAERAGEGGGGSVDVPALPAWTDPGSAGNESPPVDEPGLLQRIGLKLPGAGGGGGGLGSGLVIGGVLAGSVALALLMSSRSGRR